MKLTVSCRSASVAVAIVLLLGLTSQSAIATGDGVVVTQITPRILVFATTAGNVVASVGRDGALLVGTPSAVSTARISSIVESRTKSALRYVVIGPQSSARSEGDAGWGRRAAFVAMQENALRRLDGDVMGEPGPLPPRFIELGVDRPRVAFSEVLAFDLNGDSVHVVHQTPGYSDADAIVHFHVDNVIYFGEVFPGDGYPEIDAAQGGKLEGLLKTLAPWTAGPYRVVPARGKVTDAARVKAFRDMIVTVRDRVQHLAAEGRTEAQVVAARPTADFDAQWGHGRVSSEAFVHEVYSALSAQ